MFTGIIKKTAKVLKAEKKNGGMILAVERPNGWKIALGNSIAVDGACLTVASLSKKEIIFELTKETLDKTYFGSFFSKFVNLEPALKAGDELGGHFVLGHIDCVGKILSVKKEKSGTFVSISFPKEFSKLAVFKGSIAVDGISLTIAGKKGNSFSVCLAPYTLSHTYIASKGALDKVNLEFDILGKYIMNK